MLILMIEKQQVHKYILHHLNKAYKNIQIAINSFTFMPIEKQRHTKSRIQYVHILFCPVQCVLQKPNWHYMATIYTTLFPSND